VLTTLAQDRPECSGGRPSIGRTSTVTRTIDPGGHHFGVWTTMAILQRHGLYNARILYVMRLLILRATNGTEAQANCFCCSKGTNTTQKLHKDYADDK
jgi:hypothetical protein